MTSPFTIIVTMTVLAAAIFDAVKGDSFGALAFGLLAGVKLDQIARAFRHRRTNP